MTYIIFDTETTGLPLYGIDNPADAPYQPRMCSIAAALLDDKGIPTAEFSSLVKPENWPLEDPRFVANMEQARAKAHGLTFERLMDEGKPIAEIYEQWESLYSQATYVSAYNVWFDHKIIRVEWKRLGHPIPFREKKALCVMKGARGPCGLPKNPKLSEAVSILLGRDHVKSHDAKGDLDVTIELFQVLLAENALLIDEQPEAKS